MTSLQTIQKRIQAACHRANRNPHEIKLIAVSKGHPIEKIDPIYQAGQRAFGENYVQELLEKQVILHGKKIEWHFLGHLQKNKISKIIDRIDWLHSLDSLKLACSIHKKSEIPLKSLLEIKLAAESGKTGLSPQEAIDLFPKFMALQKIDIRGLMTIPPAGQNPNTARQYFKELFSLLKEINKRYAPEKPLTELSMGMSSDFEIAIEEGSTMVRIGEAIFGKREKK